MIDHLYSLAGLNVNSPREAFRQIAIQLSKHMSIEPQRLYDALCVINKQDHAGIGRGLAVPQGRVPFLTQPLHLIATLKKSINFDSLDHMPVDLIFIVLSPEKDVKGHLSRLAYISRMLKDDDLCDRLKGCETTDAMQALLLDSNMPYAKAA